MSLWTLCAFTTTAVAEEVDYTSSIVNADLSTTDAWNTEGTKGISGGVVKVGSGSTFDFSQTITIPAGHYKMTAKAAYRYGANEQEEYDAIQASANTHLAKLYAQTAAQTFEANVFNRYEGASETDYAAGDGSVTVNGLFVPNSSDAVKAWFAAGQYVNVLEFDVLEDGDVKIGIVKTESAANGDYANIGAWTLTRTGDAQNTGEGEGEGEGDDTNTIDVDKTSLVGTSRDAWKGNNGGPVTIDGVSLPEKYETTTATLGDVMWQTVEGLDNGTYTVELYANARYTPGRGFNSDATDGALDFTYLYANNVEISIPVYHNGDLNNGQSYTLEGVEVTDGTLKMGMTKKAAGSNWHTIQIKSLTLHTTGDAALESAKETLAATIAAAQAITPTTDELTAAIATAQGVYDTATVAADVDAATAALEVAITIANNTNSVAGASATNPIVTNFVVNGTFDTWGETSPWKTTTGAQNQTTANNQAGAFTGNFFENWNPGAYTGKIYQTIENIPNGVYELSICAFVSVFDASCQYVYGNDAKTYLTAGAPTAYKVVFEVTDNTAEVGFEQTVAKAEWCGIDNVSLTYYGAETTLEEVLLGSYIRQVEELRATATDLLTKVNDANKPGLEDALAATETIEATEEAYKGAIEILVAANNAAKANADLKAAIDNYYDLMASTNVYTQEAYNTFKAIADDYLAKWEVNELTAVVNPYAIQGWHAEVNYDDFLLSAWGTNNFDTNLYINTWSTEGGADGSNFTVPFFEYWTGDDQSLGATTKTATVTGLVPNAEYTVSAWVRARMKNGATAPTYGITLSVGADGTPVDVSAGAQVGTSQFYLGEFTATGVADAEGNLTINFNVAADNNISWLSYKNVKYAGPSNLDFSKDTPIDNHICTYAKDAAGNGTTYSQMQPVTSWDMAVENGDARAAGVFAYGSNLWLGSAGNYVPATNPEGVAEGNALGVVGVWDAVAQYTQKVTLPAGTYNMMVPIYKASAGTTAPQKSLIGFIAENGTEYLAPAKVYTQGAWTYEIVTFTLDEKTSGVLSLGYDATNAGSGAQQALFIDGVQFVADSYIPVANLKTAISAAEANANAKFANVGEALFQIPTSAYETYVAAIADAKAVANNAEATAEELAAAVETLAAATTAFAAIINTPDPEKTYMIMHEAAGTFLALNGGVKVEAEQTPIKFEAAADGKYYIANANGEYVYYSGTGDNKWSLNVSADNKEAWTIAAVGEGVYTIKGKNGFLGTDAATAGSTCYGDKAATNWVITEYVAPVVPFEVTLVNPAVGTTKLEEGDSIKFTTNKDAEVGFIYVGVLQVSDEDPTNTEYLTSYRYAVKGESDWSVELFSTMKFRQGYTYKFEFTAYESEDAYNQEPYDAPGSAAIGTDTIAFAGTLPAYAYAAATLNDIKPAYDAVIESETDNVVTLTFSAPVKVQDAQSVVREGGFMAPPTVYTYTPVAVDADENGFATTWTFEMKLFPGSTNVTFAAVDAEDRRVQGNMGEEETSYFSYEWQCTVGIPDITIAPAGEVEGPVAALTASCEAGIGDFTWMCEMSEAVVLDAEGNVVATVANVEKIVDESLESYTPEWYEALAAAPNTLTLSAEITEPGTYTVKIPAGYFTVDSEKMYMCKATEATFTIVKNEQVGINGIAADDVVETKYFGVNGAALNAPVKGVNIVKQTLKDGKVVTSKVYVK